MSGNKIALVRSFYAAHAAGDLRGAKRLMDPEFEFVPSSVSHFSGPIRGPEAFNRGLAELIEQFESFEPVPEEIIDAGPKRVVVSLHRSARSHGVQLEDRVAHVLTVGGGRMTRIAAFQTLAEAKEAAGLGPGARPAAVIFDNDGLLLDTETVWTRGEEDLFRRRGLEFTLAHKQELVGTSAQRAGAILAKRLGEPGRETELIAELDALVVAELERGVEPMPGAVELVGELHARGHLTGVVSNSPAPFISRALELGGLDGFAAIVSGHDVPAPKPAPDAYLAACERLGVAAGPDVVVLEDSPTGVAAARAAGLTVIGVPSLAGIELTDADEVFAALTEPGLRSRLGL